MPPTDENKAKVEADKVKKKESTGKKPKKPPGSQSGADAHSGRQSESPPRGLGGSSRDSVASGPTSSTVDRKRKSTTEKIDVKTPKMTALKAEQPSPNDRSAPFVVPTIICSSKRSTTPKKPPAGHVESAADSARKLEVRIDMPMVLRVSSPVHSPLHTVAEGARRRQRPDQRRRADADAAASGVHRRHDRQGVPGRPARAPGRHGPAQLRHVRRER